MLVDDDVLAGPGLAGGHAAVHAGAPGRVVLGYMPVRLPAHRDRHNFASFLYAAEYEALCRRFEREDGDVLLNLWAGNLSLRRVATPWRSASRRAGSPSATTPTGSWASGCGHRLRGVFARELRAEHLHDRPLPAFLGDARSQGRAAVALHALHGDALGELDPARFAGGLPAPARWTVRVARRARLRGPLEAALERLIVASGRAGALRAQVALARLARRVAQQSGALEAGRAGS